MSDVHHETPSGRGRGSGPDKVVGGLGAIGLVVLVAGLVAGNAGLVVGGFLTLFVVACWFGLAF